MPGDYNQFLKYIEGKSVAIIGSGSSILKQEYGKEIDSHDIVVRINRGYPYERYRQYVGNRTDIWSFGMGGRDDLRRKMHELFSDRKYSMYPWYASSWVPSYIKNLDNHITLPPVFSKTAEQHCGGKPATTGADTLHFFVTGTKRASITIYGIDCYKSEYWFKEVDNSIPISETTKELLEKQKLGHQIDEEEKFIQRLVDDYRDINWAR